MALGVVIGRNGFNSDVVGNLQLIAIFHYLARAIHVGTALVGNKAGLIACQHLDGIFVEVVKVFVGHQEVVSLRHRGIVNHLVSQLRHRVNLNLFAVILNADAGMHERMERHGLAAFGVEHICFKSRLPTGSSQAKHDE